MDEKRCTCGTMDVRVVACSGGSNVGQIANDAAIQLAKEKAASFFCLAGVGGHIEGIVKSANKLAGVVTPRLIVGDDIVVDASPWCCNYHTHRRHHNPVLDLDPPNAPRAEQSLVHMLQHIIHYIFFNS